MDIKEIKSEREQARRNQLVDIANKININTIYFLRD